MSDNDHDLTLEERLARIAELRREAAAKQAHADALEAERDRRLKEGTLEIGPEVSPDEPKQ
jgi:hypothetical protein